MARAGWASLKARPSLACAEGPWPGAGQLPGFTGLNEKLNISHVCAWHVRGSSSIPDIPMPLPTCHGGPGALAAWGEAAGLGLGLGLSLGLGLVWLLCSWGG